MTNANGIHAALVRAQRTARAVAKHGKNEHHRYAYARSDDILESARATLLAEGLALMVISYAIESRGEERQERERRDSPMEALELHILSAKYRLVHEGGESIEIASSTPIIPERGRPLDKAAAAAKTNDLAYVMRGVLMLPRVDDVPDIEARDDRSYRPKARPMPTQKHGAAASEPANDLDAELRAHYQRLGRGAFLEAVGDLRGADDERKRAALAFLARSGSADDVVLEAKLDAIARDIIALTGSPTAALEALLREDASIESKVEEAERMLAEAKR